MALQRRLAAKDFNLQRFTKLARHLGVWRKIEQLVQGLVLR